MSSSLEWMRGMGSGMSWRDVLDMARSEHGAGATRWLADQLGVDIRQPQRWYRGEGTPGSAAAARLPGVMDGLRRPWVAAKLRRVRRVNVGTIRVHSLSAGAPDGSRNPPALDVGPIMDQVAAAYAAGDDHQAQALFDAAVVNAYAGDSLDDEGGLAAVIGVSDYQGGIEVVD